MAATVTQPSVSDPEPEVVTPVPLFARLLEEAAQWYAGGLDPEPWAA